MTTALTRSRKLGWAIVLLACTGLYLALHFRVNAVKSEVALAERAIVRLEKERSMLETEFLTRASQQQLADWNDVEFGYQAPSAAQYLGNERQLAQYGAPRAKDAPQPIRVARNDVDTTAERFEPMVSPLTGRKIDDAIISGRPDMTARYGGGQSGPMRITLNAVAESTEP